MQSQISTNGKQSSSESRGQLVFPSAVVAHSDAVSYLQYLGNDVSYASKPMVIESAWPLMVNGEHWLTLLCTPTKLRYFVLGFLYNEGLITTPTDVLDLQIGEAPEAVIRVELQDRDTDLPKHRTLTSGCGGGITFVDLAAAREPIDSPFQISVRQISNLMSRLMAIVAKDRHRIGGFHTAGLSDGHQLLAVATDIGRHNTLDKVAGECLVHNISMQDAILLTTGRVSTEMMGKAARMQVPVIVTLNSPTHLAAELARQWGITLIGYARGTKMQVYTGWQRILVNRAEPGDQKFLISSPVQQNSSIQKKPSDR